MTDDICNALMNQEAGSHRADDAGTARRRPPALGAAPLQRRPAAVGREAEMWGTSPDVSEPDRAMFETAVIEVAANRPARFR
ncbi:hypothetical protein [Pseudarthrobacter sp. H2]|uniref:hypothetical protein n=1 Tax=Pseudarthrobacter sp. H2 TaxID=3418415 RepID=UPI003CE9CD2A